MSMVESIMLGAFAFGLIVYLGYTLLRPDRF